MGTSASTVVSGNAANQCDRLIELPGLSPPGEYLRPYTVPERSEVHGGNADQDMGSEYFPEDDGAITACHSPAILCNPELATHNAIHPPTPLRAPA